MRKHFAGLALVTLLALAPAYAQAPKGWKMHTDHSSEASDPDAPGVDKFTVSGSGFHALNPMAAIYWNPANTATGSYTLKGTFKLIKSMGYNVHRTSWIDQAGKAQSEDQKENFIQRAHNRGHDVVHADLGQDGYLLHEVSLKSK